MKAKEFDIKKRDPNWKTMQAKGTSGAAGKHKDKKKAAKQGEVKHKGQMAEGTGGVSVRQWANQVRKDHGPDVKFRNRQEGGGAVDSVIATNSQGETVGVYNRKTGFPTVFEPKQGVSEGDEPDEEYLDKVISDLHKDALGFRPDQEFGREWMASSFEEKLEIYNRLLKSLHSDMDEVMAYGTGFGSSSRSSAPRKKSSSMLSIMKAMKDKENKEKKSDKGSATVTIRDKTKTEASDFGEPREILEDVLQTLEREVEWPLTDVMDPREVKQLLAPIVKAVNDKMMSMSEAQDDWGSMSHKEFKRRELEHELGHENKPRENKGMWFYNVPKGKELEAKSYGLKQTKSGKWYSRRPNSVSDKEFGQGRYWEPK